MGVMKAISSHAVTEGRRGTATPRTTPGSTRGIAVHLGHLLHRKGVVVDESLLGGRHEIGGVLRRGVDHGDPIK